MRLASSVGLLCGLALSTPSPARVPGGDALRGDASFAAGREAGPFRLGRAPSMESRSVAVPSTAYGLTCYESDLLIGPVHAVPRDRE
jgi:hypothetical protein